MEIKTKYALGDSVWAINNKGKAYRFEIQNITICAGGEVKYTGQDFMQHSENRCFDSLDELLEYVKSPEA
ncbi:MAG: hypothetical protein NC418_02420 [Muribaculaceae bacterium]|nr:hypothetical protein [Muribaculaceae bacterium]